MELLGFLLVVIAVVGEVLLGFFTFSQNPRSATNKLFFLFATSFSVYILFNFLIGFQTTAESTFFWVKMVMTIAVVINLSFYLLASTFPDPSINRKSKKLTIYLVWTFLMLPLPFLSLIFTEVSVVGSSTQTNVPGPAMPVFLAHTVVLLGDGFLSLIKKYKRSAGIKRAQTKFFLGGAIFMFSALLITNLVFVVLFNTSEFIGLLPLYSLIFIGFVSYAIVKHELFNVKVIATQVLTVIILIILLSKLFTPESTQELMVDLFIFLTVLIFGILLIRSVMREVKQREELGKLNEKLKELDKQKDVFISMAAHELRAPMTAIKGYLSMIIEGDTGDISDKARGYLTDATAINDRLVRLVNNMLNVSRIEEGRMVYQLEVESLSNVARTAYATFRPEAERKSLEFKLEIPKELKDKVEVDPDRIHEVLANLLSNSIKYTDHGSITLKLSQPSPTTILSEVIDTGPGISDEEQEKLFNKFYRAESTVGKTTGTGLGLYICKLLVEKFNGRIGVKSKTGSGSTFWFELPLAHSSPKQS